MNNESEQLREFYQNNEMLLDKYSFYYIGDAPKLNGEIPKEKKRKVKEFIDLCVAHVVKYTSGEIGKENIVVVHPYHNYIDSGKLAPEIACLETIVKNADKEIKRVIFDSHLDYAKKTSKLVDEGNVDKVVFTYPSFGCPFEIKDLKGFSHSKKNYIGGVYGYECVNNAISYINKFAPSFSIKPIKDAILFRNISFKDKIDYKVELALDNLVSILDILNLGIGIDILESILERIPYFNAMIGSEEKTGGIESYKFNIGTRLYTSVMGVKTSDILRTSSKFE